MAGDAEGFWRMGFDARSDGRQFAPPVLVDANDPRTRAWIDGWETADHDILAGVR